MKRLTHLDEKSLVPSRIVFKEFSCNKNVNKKNIVHKDILALNI